MFGNQGLTTTTPSAFGFPFGSATAPSAITSTMGQGSAGTGSSFAFGAPSFNFGSTINTTTSQTPAPGQTFSFGGGSFNLAMTTAQSTTSTPSLFGFTNPPSSINAATGLDVSKLQSNFNFFPAPQMNTTAPQATPFNLTQQGMPITTSTNNPAASLFWNPSAQQTTSSLMGQSCTSPFAVAPQNTTSTSVPFGLASNAPSNAFGSANATTMNTALPFGMPSGPASTTAFSFRTAVTTSTPLFGATGFGTTSSAFGSAINSGSIFGTSSLFAPPPTVAKSEPAVPGSIFSLTSQQPASSATNHFGFGLSFPPTATTSTVPATGPAAPMGFSGFSMPALPAALTSASPFTQPASTMAAMPTSLVTTNTGPSNISTTPGFSLPTAQPVASTTYGTPNFGLIAPITITTAPAATSSSAGFNFTGFSKPTPTFFPPATTTTAQASSAAATQPAASFLAQPSTVSQTTNGAGLVTMPTVLTTTTTGGPQFNVPATITTTTSSSSLSKGPAVTSLFFPPPASTSATTMAPIVASAPSTIGMGSFVAPKPNDTGPAQASTVAQATSQSVTTVASAAAFKFDAPPISKFSSPVVTNVSIAPPATSSISTTNISSVGLTFPSPMSTTSTTNQVPAPSLAQTSIGVVPAQEATPVIVNYRQLGDCIANWKLDFEDMEQAFVDQAMQINLWEALVRANGKKLNKLSGDVECARLDQERIGQQLDFLASQQEEINTLLLGLENEYGTDQSLDPNRVAKTMPKFFMGGTVMNADSEREETFSMAEQIDSQLNYMEQSLKDLVEDVNGLDNGKTLATSKDCTDGSALTATQITQILNTHLDLLRWIENNIENLGGKLQEMLYQSFAS